MRRALLLSVLILWFSAGPVAAQGAANPVYLVKQGQWGVGFQWSYVFGQRFDDYELQRKYSDGVKNSVEKGAKFENDQYYLATIAYGILDRANVFVKLGMVGGGKWLDYQHGNDWRGKLDSNFVWAVGARGNVYEFSNGIGFALSGQYLRYDNRRVKNWVYLETGQSAADFGWSTDDELDYWQVDVVADTYWKLGAFTPYVGAGYTHCDVDFSGRWTNAIPAYGSIDYDASFSNEDEFTALAGINIDIPGTLQANVQGTFVSSTAVAFSIRYCF